MSLLVSIQIPGESRLRGTGSTSGPVSVAKGKARDSRYKLTYFTSRLCTLWRRVRGGEVRKSSVKRDGEELD